MIHKADTYFEDIKEYLDTGKRPENDRFILPNTSMCLRMVGCDDTPITLPVSVVKKAIEKHKLSKEEIITSLAQLYDPILIFDSDREHTTNNVDSKLIFTNVFKENKPLALAINKNSIIDFNQREMMIISQDIRSIHDRMVIARNGTDLIKQWTEQGLCKYVDDKKISDWSTAARVYFPIELLQSDISIVPTKSDIVNNKDILNRESLFRYQLLSRLQSDCDSYLSGRGSDKQLWAQSVREQIIKMKLLHSTFNNVEKPEWINFQEITEYEKNMAERKKEIKDELNLIIEGEDNLQTNLSSEEKQDLFSFNKTEEKLFGEKVDEWLENNTNPNKLVIVGKTPPVMKVLGITDNLIEVEESTFDKLIGHNLSIDDIYDIPNLIADPVMVFKSRTHNDSYVYFTERKNAENRSILIPFAVNKRMGRILINEITSMYGRNNEIDYVESNIDEGNLLYLDKKRSMEWVEKNKSFNGERKSKLQLLGQRLTDIETSNIDILTKERLVNLLSSSTEYDIKPLNTDYSNSKRIATNYVLDKLKSAGIEVITDKDEFDRIIASEEKLEKMIKEKADSVQIEKQQQLVNGLILKNQPKGTVIGDSIAENFSLLDQSLRFNANFEIKSKNLNSEVSVFPGSIGKSGMGIRHIIEERSKKDTLSTDEITALSALVLESVKDGEIIRDSDNRCEFSKNGIIAIVRKDYDDEEKNWILTGFAYNGENAEKNREATETIQTVIAQYGQSQDYSYFRNQVGAVIASLDTSITYTNQKSINQNYNLAVEENQNISPSNTIKVTSMQTNEIQQQVKIGSAIDVVPLLSNFAQDEVENFGVITLDNACKVKEVRVVSVGTINRSLVHPREVFKEAIRTSSAAIILFHNHPSGSLEPSKEDLETTKQLLKAAEVTGIKILDHIIVSPEGYKSFEEEDILDDLKPRSSFMKNSDITYGFTHKGKIYLNPEVLNTNTPVHEYVHLWDKYTQTTNPELWEKGKDVFKNTTLWNEVQSDPNYQNIANDEDLVLSECHARICGDIAEKVLERIAERDGEIAKNAVIDWDTEVRDYLFNQLQEMAPETPEWAIEQAKIDFITQPIKDLMNGKDIHLNLENLSLPTTFIRNHTKTVNPGTIEEKLFTAIETDDITQVIELLSYGANPLARDQFGNNAFQIYAEKIDLHSTASLLQLAGYILPVEKTEAFNTLSYLQPKTAYEIGRDKYLEKNTDFSDSILDKKTIRNLRLLARLSDREDELQYVIPEEQIEYRKERIPLTKEEKEAKENERNSQIAEFFIKGIETNTAPWMKSWKAGQYVEDFNPVTGNVYSGINSLYLPIVRDTLFKSDDPRWYTFNNARELDFQVIKGSKSTSVDFFKMAGVDKNGKIVENDGNGNPLSPIERFIPIKKSFAVFHASQLQIREVDKEGNVTYKPIPAYEKPDYSVIKDFVPVEKAEKLIEKTQVQIIHDQVDRSYYSSGSDQIHLCNKNQYLSEGEYYGTLLHELVHWTGGEKRLDRDTIKQYAKTEMRAREELIAEIGSYQLCKELNLDFNPQNAVAYVQSWATALKNNPDEILTATKDATKAKQFITDFEPIRQNKVVEHGQKISTVAVAMELPIPEKKVSMDEIKNLREPSVLRQISTQELKETYFFPPMIEKEGKVNVYLEKEILELTKKQTAVLLDYAIKKETYRECIKAKKEGRKPEAIIIAEKNTMSKAFNNLLEQKHPSLSLQERKETYEKLYSGIAAELQGSRNIQQKVPANKRTAGGMEW